MTIPTPADGGFAGFTPTEHAANSWVAANWHKGLRLAGSDSNYGGFHAFIAGAEYGSAERATNSNPGLIAAMEAVFAMLESGELVRDISKDADPDYTLRMLRFVQTLNGWQMALAAAKGSL